MENALTTSLAVYPAQMNTRQLIKQYETSQCNSNKDISSRQEQPIMVDSAIAALE